MDVPQSEAKFLNLDIQRLFALNNAKRKDRIPPFSHDEAFQGPGT
jgi:hypothetical protein